MINGIFEEIVLSFNLSFLFGIENDKLFFSKDYVDDFIFVKCFLYYFGVKAEY